MTTDLKFDDTNVVPLSAAPNPFDPELYRKAAMDPNIVAVKPLLTSLSVRKVPARNDFVRIHPGEEFTMPGRMYIDKSTSDAVANDLMQAHKRTYRKFWQWIEQFVGTAVALRRCHTVLGWGLQIAPGYNARTLYNFPMQGNGAEMLRQGCCLGTERGIEVAAPVHDAVMICAPLNHLEHDIAPMQAAMAQASRIILDGFELRTEAKPVRYPDRFVDPRGKHMWETVQQLMGDLKCKKAMA
jgi:hypothetical protein